MFDLESTAIDICVLVYDYYTADYGYTTNFLKGKFFEPLLLPTFFSKAIEISHVTFYWEATMKSSPA
jgi:hypothetical protein